MRRVRSPARDRQWHRSARSLPSSGVDWTYQTLRGILPSPPRTMLAGPSEQHPAHLPVVNALTGHNRAAPPGTTRGRHALHEPHEQDIGSPDSIESVRREMATDYD